MSKVLTSVAWPYANGPRHLGHVAGFAVPSDVFSRYMRMAGHDVLMVSGSDEHGTPILVLDKIPAVDTVNDTIQTFIRPSMGGLIFAATSAAESLDQSTWMKDNPWVGIVLGILVLGLVHTGKMAARPVLNTGTVGAAAPVVSTVEDGASIGLSLLAIFLPILVVLALVLMVALFAWVLVRWRRWRRNRDAGLHPDFA